MTGGIHVGPQEAHLVRAALERRHAGIQESEQEVRWLQVALCLESDGPLKDLSYIWHRAGERGTPTVSLTRPARIKGRQVDIINALLQILHIEEGALPLLARLLPLQSREACGLASIEGATPHITEIEPTV
jgi:hypothetical protein